MALFIIFSILYIAFFVWALIHWNRIKDLSLNIESDLNFSIIIPLRNEENNIQHLLTDLENLDYARDKFEVVFINDHSSDETAEMLERFLPKCSFDYQLVQLADYFRAGKKEAITIGVERAKYEYVITTDGDCSIPPGWISAYATAYAQFDAVMITGPVRMTGESVFQKLQSYEFSGLIGIGAASVQSGKPGMCNGANLSYLKVCFEEVGGYEGNDFIASGDDEFLLQKLYRRYPERVTFLKNRKAIITTPAKSSLKSLINQRIRWSSKWRFHKSWYIKGMAVLTYLNYLVFLYALVMSIIDYWLIGFLCVLLVRWLSVFIFTYFVRRFLSLDRMLRVSLLAEIIYPFFVLFLGLASIFGKYSWKGRLYT